MTEDFKPKSHIAPRPSTGDRVYSIASGENKDSYAKLAFNQLDSKGLVDPFQKYYRVSEQGIEILKPPVNPYALVKMIQENSFLSQCIDAMTTNIHGFGYRLEFIGKDEEKNETSPEAQKELQWLEELFDHPNTYMTFQEFRERLSWDYWVFGNAFIEITRDNKGRVATMHHIPAPTMRITKVDTVATPVKESLMRAGQKVSVNSQKNFRRYVQVDDLARRVWFKELGDPRTIDPKNGKENTALSSDNAATEIIHLAKYNGQSVYGIPIWISQAPNIVGSRQAELTNLDFFENNAVPALAILVSGGYLTEEAFNYLASNFDSVKGRGSTNKVLVIEARGAVEDSSSTGAVPVPTIQLKALSQERQQDALFQEYENNVRDKIRSVFRLPTVFTGAGDAETTYASAKVSLETAENQIFTPERNKFDAMVNSKILESWDPQYFRFRSNPAAIVTSDDLFKAIETFSQTGAMTPNVAIGILNEKLNLDIPRITEFWGDMPYDLVTDVIGGRAGPDQAAFVVKAMEILSKEDIKELQDINITPPPTVTITEQGSPATVTTAPDGTATVNPASTTTSVTTLNATPDHANAVAETPPIPTEKPNETK